MGQDRESIAAPRNLITDPVLVAEREAENGIRQFRRAVEIIREHAQDPERPFRLAPRHILELNYLALEGIHPMAGTYRNSSITISKSKHIPPQQYFVAEEVAQMCDYVNLNWTSKSAVYLGAYLLWKLNWIHPFADGNGRTSRIISFIVINLRLDGLLPGSPTVPDQIVANKEPYYDALEAADEAWLRGELDLSAMEGMLTAMLARQFTSAVQARSDR